jgi:hypothetical protein
VVFERLLTTPFSRIASQIAVMALGLWLAFPLLGQCLSGPYSDVPEDVRQIIENHVIEARPAGLLLRADPALLARVLLPPLIITLLAMMAAWCLWPRISTVQRTAIIQAFAIVGVGLGFALAQIRAVNLMTPAVPLLGGFLVYAFTQIPRTSVSRIPALILLILAMPATVQRSASVLEHGPNPDEVGLAQTKMESVTDCRTASAMAEISSLPNSIIFSSVNLGPTILAFTDHSVTSAAYHRSPDAFWNGIGAFQSEDKLRASLAKSRADFLVLCPGGVPEAHNKLSQTILAGTLPDWLRREPGDRKELRVFRVNRLALLLPESDDP